MVSEWRTASRFTIHYETNYCIPSVRILHLHEIMYAFILLLVSVNLIHNGSELQFYRKLGPQEGMTIFIMTMRIKKKRNTQMIVNQVEALAQGFFRVKVQYGFKVR